MSDFAQMIVELSRRVATLENHLEHVFVSGKVCDVDHARGLYKMEYKAGQGGEPVKSAWIPRQEEAGTINTHTPLKTGQPVHMLSPGGQIGTKSTLIPASHSDENPRHSNLGAVPSFEVGNARFAIQDGKIELTVGDEARVMIETGKIALDFAGKRVVVDGSGILTDGKTRLNNGTRKTHYVGGKDSGGDVAREGAEGVLI